MLPHPHLPRPARAAELEALLQAHRLVVFSAGAFAGKTTLLAEFARSAPQAKVFWYSVDDLDATTRVLLEGLAHAVGGAVPAGDESRLLAYIIGALEEETGHTVLIIDDLHRSAVCLPLAERLLRYMPPHAHLVLSGRPQPSPPPLLWSWLEDRDQVAYITGSDLRLDEDEQQRFRAVTGQLGGVWAVGYRRGGQAATVAGLRAGVLPALPAESRAVIDTLAVLPLATASVVGAVLSFTAADTAQCLDNLNQETILLERLDAAHYRLSEAARKAALAELDAERRAALRARAAAALEALDPAQATYLFAQSDETARAVAAARRVSWWDWRGQTALGMSIAALLPPDALCRLGALGLVVAHLRLVDQGPRRVHALIRSIRPTSPLEQIERLRLLTHCCASRGWSWSLDRCAAHLEALVEAPDSGMTALVRSYGLAALGIARDWQGRYGDAAAALRRGLNLLTLAAGDDAQIAYVRLLSLRALAHVNERESLFDEAERAYAEAHKQAVRERQPFVELELINNWAVLSQQRGHHTHSAEMLRQALASPWSAERGLRVVLYASLADALDALGDRTSAAQALHSALADVQEKDLYGLSGHLHATLALLLAEAGHTGAAAAELAAGAPSNYPATLLARALLRDVHDMGTRSALERVLAVAGSDAPLRARVRAHLARVCAVQCDRPYARKWADVVVNDRAYPLTPREAAILGPRTRRIRRPRPLAVPSTPSGAPITVRFFGSPTLTFGGEALGSVWWAHSKARELLWYALAHGKAGFTRAEACADLFPDMDAERGVRALRNLLYELRKLLRSHCGVDLLQAPANGNMRLLPENLSPIWEADTSTLERCLAQLRRGELDVADELPVLLAGRYLADLDADWTRPFRHYWESEALHALDLAATHYERAGRAAEALACLRRAVEYSPDDAALLRRVMLLYHATGDLGGLRAAYLLHRRAMREELGAEPDHELAALYQTLTRS